MIWEDRVHSLKRNAWWWWRRRRRRRWTMDDGTHVYREFTKFKSLICIVLNSKGVYIQYMVGTLRSSKSRDNKHLHTGKYKVLTWEGQVWNQLAFILPIIVRYENSIRSFLWAYDNASIYPRYAIQTCRLSCEKQHMPLRFPSSLSTCEIILYDHEPNIVYIFFKRLLCWPSP